MSRPAYVATAPCNAGGERPQDIVRRRFGLVTYDHQRAAFERTVDHLTHVLGYPTRDTYLEALARLERGAPEVERLLRAITVGESYFFRDSAQLEFIEQHWIPDLVARKREGKRTVRVWSAGCSQGQEIYTVAMLLDRHLPGREEWDLQLIGTDINQEALNVAAAGRYRQWSLRSTPEWARTQYMEQRGHEWSLIPRIRSMPTFEYINLVEDRFPWAPVGAQPFDLILCRNVFIYFDRDAVRSVMTKFSRCLDPNGVLLLGPADIVSERCQGLELKSWKRAQYYVLKRPGRSGTREQPVPSRLARTAPPSRSLPLSADAATSCLRQPTACSAVDAEDVEALLRRGAWEAATVAADAWLARHGEAAHMLERSARAKASLGRLDEAVAAADRSLALEPLNRDAHFIRGLVFMERGEPHSALAALRRAVYVDKGFLEAHCHLGFLLLQQGRHEAGQKSLRNALAIAQRADPDASPNLFPGLTYAELVASLRRELTALGATTESGRP